MKSKFHLLFICLSSTVLFGFSTQKDLCVEIKDRKNLPPKIYESLKNYNVLLIGELHGNNETPEFVEGVVNLMHQNGQKVLLGLEINADIQMDIDSFLNTGNFQIIEQSKFFNRQTKFGVSSIAYANLIKSCYKKGNVKIVCYDTRERSSNRDSTMAINLVKALNANPAWKLLTLSGDVHNKLLQQHHQVPMGYYLSNMLRTESIASIDVIYESGSSWCCTQISDELDCGPHDVGSSAGDLAKKYSFDNFFAVSGDKNYFFTRKITASQPLNK